MSGKAAGFTLVELVVVIILLGILSAYAAPKFSGRGGYPELAAQQNMKQSIRYAQQRAMSRTAETFSFVSSAHQVDILNGTAPIGGDYPKQFPDVTLGNANVVFNRFGAPIGGLATISITGTQALTVTIEGTTGYAH